MFKTHDEASLSFASFFSLSLSRERTVRYLSAVWGWVAVLSRMLIKISSVFPGRRFAVSEWVVSALRVGVCFRIAYRAFRARFRRLFHRERRSFLRGESRMLYDRVVAVVVVVVAK